MEKAEVFGRAGLHIVGEAHSTTGKRRMVYMSVYARTSSLIGPLPFREVQPDKLVVRSMEGVREWLDPR